MFIIFSTSVVVFLQTYFDSFLLAGSFSGVVLVAIFVCVLFRIGSRATYKLCLVFCVLICALFLRIQYKNSTYIAQQEGIKPIFMGTGIILESHGNDRYVLQTADHTRFLYYGRGVYLPGTELFVTAGYEKGTGAVDFFSGFSLNQIQGKSKNMVGEERGFDKGKWLFMKGWLGVLYEKNAKILYKHENDIFDKIRLKLASQLKHSYSKETFALTLGMLVGDRSGLSKEEYEGFVESGLVHLIAVSGGNIVLIVSFLTILLFFLPYYVRMGVISIVIIGYAILCGMDSSVMRATCMAVLSMLSLFVGRTLSVWRSMGYVYIGMLLYNPYFLVYDLGFIFSFGALCGLVFFAERWGVNVKKKISLIGLLQRFRNIYILPSVAAALGIIVPLLFFTGRVNLLSILSNIVVIPLVPFVMIYGFFASLTYSITSWERITLPQERGVGRIYIVNELTNRYSLTLYTGTGYTRIVVALLLYSVIVFYIIYRRK